ncbi:thiamine pyrophosphate-dependent enzyme [Fodinisporobacter ferrooxydans]|uniref:Thiamine pyrophosphate-dependent enzyme n=1 Tax=Fodinisporobacter ferrooxydans TaxID=2901836 RepID=A0ABY4CWA7_9BACL|nr:thiamine pyrophosphate-dependent enzyme [Alicyclobacillaceae bacterium MYW30-H2]
MAILESNLTSDGSVENQTGVYEQTTDFRSGNEMAARAAAQINYHLMGFYPITPSTEIAEYLDEMKVEGEHDIVMVPADGEHGAAGVCYGAAVAGGRVFNATSANGFLYMLEQLPVQSGTRFPMVLNLVTRSVSGPLDIRGDHSDLYYGLNVGWPILLAKEPQAVYDMNIIALRLAEHKDIRLPVIVASDGFFTSHQKRRVQYFSSREAVQRFVGEMPNGYLHALDVNHPITIGPYMNDPDYINNKFQQSNAMFEAERVFAELTEEYAKISGRKYEVLDLYQMEDAEIAVFLLNSASDTAKDVVDELRAQGIKAGVIAPNMIRPFPVKAIQHALKDVKVVLVGERAESFGGHGGNMTFEVKAALQEIHAETKVLTRIYGLGGKDFFAKDAEAFFQSCIDAMNGQDLPAFDYHGHMPGNTEAMPQQLLQPLTKEQTTGFVSVEKDEQTGQLKVKVPPLRALTAKARRLAPGHGACPGCGIFPGVETFLRGIEGDVVVLYQTGCAMVTTTGYPYSSHKVTYIHNLFQNGAATLSGTVEMFHERKRRGEIEIGDDITFVMVTGDGGMDIGMGPAIGAALRNHKMIILEYDNEGYMNTGAQLSYSTPLGHMTATSNVGGQSSGKSFHHKDTPQLMAATNIPYVFTGTEAFAQDLIKKAAKAQWYAKHEGLAYGKILIACPLNWKAADDAGNTIVGAAVNSCFFPLYEVENGITTITYNPEEKNKRVPASEWLKLMGKTKHLLKPEYETQLKRFEEEVERRWVRLKAKHENPYL